MNPLRRIGALLRTVRTISRAYGGSHKIRTATSLFFAVMRPRLPQRFRIPQRVNLELEGKPFTVWLADRTGIAAFEEVFLRGEYDTPSSLNPKVILDAGANIGIASVFFCLRYPGVRLYAIEPDAKTCAVLRKNLEAFPNASVHECALSDVDGEINFHIHPTSSIASSIESRQAGGRAVVVRSMKLDTFLEGEGVAEVDILKFDIEGAEYKMLGAIRDKASVRCYVGELHLDLMHASLEDIKRLLAGFSVSFEQIGRERYSMLATRVGERNG